MLAAEGAILFLERVSPALEQVDSSSGAIGSAVNAAIDALVKILAAAPVDPATREQWLERLWDAFQEDGIPYIERLGDCWGELCVTRDLAIRWADRLQPVCKMAWSPNPKLRGSFKGTTACLGALLAAGRHDELLGLLEMCPYSWWDYRQYGVKALVALGRKAEAIRYAEQGRDRNDDPVAIARACEGILLSSGRAVDAKEADSAINADDAEEAYQRYGLIANQAGTRLAWFRAVAKRYPHKTPATILGDLVAFTPGDEGKWFAAAKDAKLFDEAIALASRTPCSLQTLTRAARDFVSANPAFATEAGLAALRWLIAGYGYDITELDVRSALTYTLEAAANAGVEVETRERIRALVTARTDGNLFITQMNARRVGIPQ